MSPRRKLFYAAPLLAVALLLMLPATRWLAVRQLIPWVLPGVARSTFLPEPAWAGAWEADYQKTLAAHHGSDFAFRYAHALPTKHDEPGTAESFRRLTALVADYPDKPVIVAALLKNRMRFAVKMHRSEQDMRTPDERKGRTALPEETNDPAQVAAFVVLAEQGERLEPNNAFFPAMVAWGQFAGRRDDAATQAWLRAGTKPVFDEHDTEEITARWELNRAMNHGMETGAISRMFTQGAITYPHFAVLRSVARMASYTAWQRERRGDREGGFVIRRASRQVGQTIQYTSKSHISPVGEAMVQITSNRATETERLIKNPYKDPDSDKRWSDEKNVRYAGYLRSIGHPDEATAFMGAVAERERLQALRNAVSSQTYWGLDKKTFQWLGMWSVGYLLLAGVLFCLVFAGLFKLVYRFSPRLQNGEPLQASARWGVATGLTLPVVAGLVALSSIGLWLEPQVGMIAGFVVAALALVAPPVLLRLGWRGWGHGLLVAGATLVALAALVATGAACYLPAKSITDSFGYHGAGGMPTDAAAQAVEQTVVPVIIGLCVASVPLSLLALFGVFSKMLRVPFAAGVTRGMRAMAVPLAALLLLLWVGAFSVTLRHETAAIREMRAMVSVGEMQYLRSLGK